jgi:hypothetical protein
MPQRGGNSLLTLLQHKRPFWADHNAKYIDFAISWRRMLGLRSPPMQRAARLHVAALICVSREIALRVFVRNALNIVARFGLFTAQKQPVQGVDISLGTGDDGVRISRLARRNPALFFHAH